MRCSDCKNGEGYKEITVYDYDIKRTVKEWCERCRGKGEVPYDGDRSGVEWEGE